MKIELNDVIERWHTLNKCHVQNSTSFVSDKTKLAILKNEKVLLSENEVVLFEHDLSKMDSEERLDFCEIVLRTITPFLRNDWIFREYVDLDNWVYLEFQKNGATVELCYLLDKLNSIKVDLYGGVVDGEFEEDQIDFLANCLGR